MREAIAGSTAFKTSPLPAIQKVANEDSEWVRDTSKSFAKVLKKKEELQKQIQQSGVSEETQDEIREQTKRAALDVSPTSSTLPQLRIHKHHTAGKRERIPSAIATYLKKKEQLKKEPRSGASTETEDELRERLKKLEEQLALLQQKLEAGNAAHAAPIEQASDVEEIAKDHEAVVGVGNIGHIPTNAGKGDNERTVVEPLETGKAGTTTLAQQIQAQSSSMKSSSHQRSPPPAKSPPTPSDEVSEQSLLDELFPEASSQIQPSLTDKRPSPPKLDLPLPDTNTPIRFTRSDTRTDREKAIDALRARGETTTVLQLSHCSTALTEADFRRLIPRGLHIESWSRDGEFYKIIPGRDPLSLERLPFYYLLFSTPASALAYQKNASRLSKLSALHAPSSIHSAIPPPAGFLEDGEDIHAATSGFVLHPTGHQLDLRTVMQPYNRALRALIDAGGYVPIVSNTDTKGKKIHRVLMHIDGYEPSHWDLWQIISRHAHAHGIIWPFLNDHASALRKLRDTINLRTVAKTKLQAISTSNPRAASSLTNHHNHNTDGGFEYEDPTIASFLSTSAGSDNDAKQLNQLVMNRVYNRWIVEFEDEDAARRFASMWHRVVLPDAKDKKGAWREAEEVRWVEAEYLW